MSTNIQSFAQYCKQIADGNAQTDHHSFTDAQIKTFINLAHQHRVLPLLVSDLFKRQLNLIVGDGAVKGPAHYQITNMRIKAQLIELDQHLASHNIKAALIKGAIQLFEPLYPSIGMREMSDIDLLILDRRFHSATADLGYQPKSPTMKDKTNRNGEHLLEWGHSHLTPIIRPNDIVTIEPHLLAVEPRYIHLLPKDFANEFIGLKSCRSLMQPRKEYALIVSLIHTLLHDRDSLEGALRLRGLIECERMYEQLTNESKNKLLTHFQNCHAMPFWNAWRALSDWLFLNDDAAHRRSIAGLLLIQEFKWRSNSQRIGHVISLLHRLFALFSIQFWTSGFFVRYFLRFTKIDFWQRLVTRTMAVIKNH
jgi:hypothetical protein